MQIRLQHQGLKVVRGACSAGAQRKKGQTRPLVERSGIHHTIEPGSPSACGLVIDYMLTEARCPTPSCKLCGTLVARRALEL